MSTPSSTPTGTAAGAVADFAAGFDFPLDPFQLTACQEVAAGRGVLVAAPTGAGKTVVGEYACHQALADGRKCFYTTPIKALSNQKFHDLVARHGAANVGLLTGDNTVNGEAPIVVMTTEVLRNMLYAGSSTLSGLAYVVMDEVHYLADRSRGAVWEEVIIHLPPSVAVIALSATVSNAEEFGDWLHEVRGDVTTIVEEKRPVPLFQHVMVGRQLVPLFSASDVDASSGFVTEGAKVNDSLVRVARDDWAARRTRDRRSPRGKGGRPQDRRGGRREVGNGRRVWIPSRVEVVDRLERDGLLPALVFIFSRAGCDAAVSQCRQARTNLTTPAERREIRDVLAAVVGDLPDEDRVVLGYDDFVDGLERGVAAHHAGMLPVFKQAVEALFVRGLCKVVFATETLALGINMPARTVVIEKLTKYNGETHADITPGEYTQLTGRAGRRGLDVEGHAVVLWQPALNPHELAGLASTRTYPLRSSFRPSYNMAVNLVHQFGRGRSRELLEQSFAQFQADRAVVGLARQLQKADTALEGYAEAAQCDRGDFMDYARTRDRISTLEKRAAQARRSERRDAAFDSVLQLHTGDVIEIPGGKFAGLAVVVDPGRRGDEPRPQVVTGDRQARRLSMRDFPEPVAALGRVRVPRSFNPRNPQQRRDLASALRSAESSLPPPHLREQPADAAGDSEPPPEVSEQVQRLRDRLAAHPCHRCPDREEHARWAERWIKLDKESGTLRRRIESRTNTVARTFDRVCDVLTALSYLDGDSVTDRGRGLQRLYSELDLLAAEALRDGTFDDLSPAELAGALSALTFTARRPEDAVAMPVGPRIQSALNRMRSIWHDLAAVESAHKLDFLREPEAGFAWAAWRWAEGDHLDAILVETGLTAGDFVRAVKQLIDLVGQIADAAGDTPLRRTARQAVDRLRRGVVAYTSLD